MSWGVAVPRPSHIPRSSAAIIDGRLEQRIKRRDESNLNA